MCNDAVSGDIAVIIVFVVDIAVENVENGSPQKLSGHAELWPDTVSKKITAIETH